MSDLLTTSPAPRYRALDAWRGVCACLVVFFHMPIAHAGQGTDWFHNFELFVDFFFVLSGFVIYCAYSQRIGSACEARSFLIRRFGRVWPLHAALLTCFALMELAKFVASNYDLLPLDGKPFSGNFSPESLITNLLLLQAFNLHGGATWNFPAWSISSEFYVYAVFAAVIFLSGARAVTFATLATLSVAVLAWLSPRFLFATHDFGIFRCLYGFSMGCLVAMLVARGGAARLGQRMATTLEIAAVAAVALFIAGTAESPTSLLAPLLFAAVVWTFAQERGAGSRVMMTRPMQALRQWSYSIYMVHVLVFVWWKIGFTLLAKASSMAPAAIIMSGIKLWAFEGWLSEVVIVGLMSASVLAMARLTFALIEAPARDAFGRLARSLDAVGERNGAESSAKRREGLDLLRKSGEFPVKKEELGDAEETIYSGV